MTWLTEARRPGRDNHPNMATSRVLRTSVAAFFAVALLGTLAFLFIRTAGTDFRNDFQVLERLRELRELDQRWDEEALRLAATLEGAPPPTFEPGPRAERLAFELDRHPGGEVVREEIARIRAGILEKRKAHEAFVAAHGQSVQALRSADEALTALETAAAVAGLKPGRAGAGGDVPTLIERIRNGLRLEKVDGVSPRRAHLVTAIATLAPAGAALDPALAAAANRASEASRAFVERRDAESTAWRAFSFLTVGARIDRAARTQSAAILKGLDEKELWRVYLFAYAVALVIGVGYLAARVVSTSAALRQANEDLERRVDARTRELSEALERLKESEAQLVQTEKMSSLGQLVAGVVHEINTPLAYVKNSVVTARDAVPELRAAVVEAGRLLDLLRSEATDAAHLQATFDSLQSRLEVLERHHVFEDLHSLTGDGLHGIEQIGELVTNLKNFSRLDRSRVASFNVNEGVKATLLIARSMLRKVDVEQRLGEVPAITCSPSQVNQVLLNIVTNAAQAIDKPRGHITIETRRVPGPAVAIEVTDDGKGIPAELLSKIFDPFFTTKDVGKGSGLGLSIAYKIVNEHGGRIEVQSRHGSGTTFIVVLPVKPPAITEAASPTPRAS